jgi:hypothetical protein
VSKAILFTENLTQSPHHLTERDSVSVLDQKETNKNHNQINDNQEEKIGTYLIHIRKTLETNIC